MITLKREELLQKLETIAPALSDHDLVPVFQHVLFNGSQVVANNDQIAIAAPLKTSFRGTTPGKMLIDTLRIMSHSDTITISADANGARISAEKTKLVLECRDPEEFSFKMPPMPKEAAEVSDDLLDAIDVLMQSTQDHSPINDYLGITFIPAADKQMKLFSSDDKSISYRRLNMPQQLGLRDRIILPTLFCAQLVRLAKDAKNCRLALRNDHAIFTANGVSLYSKFLVPADRPKKDFEAALAKHLPNGRKPIKLSEQQRPRLKIALELASRLCDIKGNEVDTEVECHKGVMEFRSSSDRGEASDKISINHPDISVRLQASLLNRVYDKYDDLLITEKCAILSRGPNSIFLIGTRAR